jgi:hypothetical protein
MEDMTMTHVGFLARILVASVVGVLPAVPALAGGNVSIGINIGAPAPPPLPMVVAAPPQLVVVPGTPVYYAPDVGFNYFVYGGQYFTLYNGSWFVATTYNGPWTFVAVEQVPRPVLAVPVTYYRVPPGHMGKVEDGPPPWAGRGNGRGPRR